MNKIAIVIVMILFPGVIAAIISNKITVHNTKWDSFKFGMYSFVLGTSCYILLQAMGYLFDFTFSKILSLNNISWQHLQVWKIIDNIDDSHIKINLLEIFQATLLALPIAFFASFLVNHKVFNKIAKKLKISNKYGDENLFSYYLNADEADWVYIRDRENNLTYQGRVDSFSENDNMQEIVLFDVTVFSYEESDELYSLPSIYLCKNMGKFVIEVIPNNLLEEYNEETSQTNN